MFLDGLYYYAYNEVAFITLNQVSPVTHSIANTIKRVCIILATVLVFGNKLTPLGATGSAIAVNSTFFSCTLHDWHSSYLCNDEYSGASKALAKKPQMYSHATNVCGERSNDKCERESQSAAV